MAYHLHLFLSLSLLFFTSPSYSQSNQFCEAGIGYGEAGCGISSSSTTKLLIQGGTVVNAHHQEAADVNIEDGIIAAVKPNVKVNPEKFSPTSGSGARILNGSASFFEVLQKIGPLDQAETWAAHSGEVFPHSEWWRSNLEVPNCRKRCWTSDYHS